MKNSPCKYCGGTNHTSLMCFSKPRTPLKNKKAINKFGKKSAANMETRNRWLQANPPDEYGYWYCYLRITPLCPYRLDIDQLTMEHVKPKGSSRETIHDLDNIKPACYYCNSAKGSSSLEYLSKKHPHLKKYLTETS